MAMKKKKTYNNILTKNMKECVEDVENTMNTIDDDIFAEPAMVDAFSRLRLLDTSERRLFIVYSELDCSIVKTANYFHVDRRTISNRIAEIKDKMEQYDTEHTVNNLLHPYGNGGVTVQDA